MFSGRPIWLKENRIAEFAVLFVAALVSYSPALGGPFLWDDKWLAMENPLIKSPLFIIEVFKHFLFLDSLSAYYRPVQNLSYMLDYWAWGDNPFGYHLSNIFWHALAALLLCQLLKRLVDANSLMPLAVALLWAVHPIHNAAVAYISGRADSLACVFALAAWLLYERSIQTKSAPYAIAAAVALFLALCSKEIAFVWIVLFFVYELGIRRHRPNPKVFGTVLAVVGFYLWLRHGLGHRSGPEVESEPLATRLLLMLRAMGDYVWLVLFPDNLHMERIIYLRSAYQSTATWQQNIRLEYLSLIGTAAIALISLACFRNWPGKQIRILGALWFVIGFLPISNLFPLNAQSAEHWIYMPSMGLLVFLAGCWPALPHGKTIVYALAVAALVARTAVRSADWADTERFFKQTIAAGGGTPRTWINLANFYAENRKLPEAERILGRTMELFPDYAPARINLGQVLLNEGKNELAEPLLRFQKNETEAFARKFPSTWRAALCLAQQELRSNRRPQALALLDEALTRHPEIWELNRLKAELIEPAAALAVVDAYAGGHWWHYPARMELARLQALTGKPAEALASWQRAAWLDIRKSTPYQLVAGLHLEQNDPEQARQWQLKALKRSPDQPSQYLFLAQIYDRLGSSDLSAKASAQAEALYKKFKTADPTR